MKFNRFALALIEDLIDNRPPVTAILDRITEPAAQGKVAFYPCNRCSNDLLKLLKQHAPECLVNIAGCFDQSPDAFTEAGIDLYPLDQLPQVASSLAAIIVTSNVFHARESEAITRLVGPAVPMVKVSGVELELAGLDPKQLIADIRKVLDLLADEKSRAVYLLAWLARLLNDENLTQLFANDQDQNLVLAEGAVSYKGYRLNNLPVDIIRELAVDIYSLGSVAAVGGDTVLDIGAFKGDTAIYFADLVGSSGRVFSFEPVQANFTDLVLNVRQNGLDDIVVPVNKGCGRSPGRLRIATAPQGSPWAFLSEERGVEDIDVTTVDEFVAAEHLERVDFIKLDVEGVELDAIIGAKKTIETFRPKMAVSLYHNLVDLTELPLMLHSMAAYNLYVRCKMAGPWSIFLYCEPR
ncbi:FkbM family methyltransferase [Geobacter pelophilus]|uniref:FkbM family methyltransferase n=1 Tax=Geoanaerobacter pelophilus TaxID=60036 RepID=A0AAW4LH96_9BACT|nr:FkbM family methyltransferase [Geoanaerobacter pelophilus]MBT0666521.1 FkbM family methyltransferase [Geoanaerobacter pelophilus]